VFRRVGAVAAAATLAFSYLVVMATPAYAVAHTYVTCSDVTGHATLSPGIGSTPANQVVTITSGSITGCTGSGPPTGITSAFLSGGGNTTQPADCVSFADPPTKIVFLGTFTATWNNGQTSTGALKAKDNTDNPHTTAKVILVLKITGGSPSPGLFFNPGPLFTKMKSTDVQASPPSLACDDSNRITDVDVSNCPTPGTYLLQCGTRPAAPLVVRHK
jgi:hypothetical protein